MWRCADYRVRVHGLRWHPARGGMVMSGMSTVILTLFFYGVFIVLNERMIVIAELLTIVVHYLRRETLLRVRVTCVEDLHGLPMLSVETGRGSNWVLLPWLVIIGWLAKSGLRISSLRS
jgi:hypothetical protein